MTTEQAAGADPRPPRAIANVALVAIAASLISAEAHAISRYNSTAMSCSAIQAAVRAEGEAILRWIQPPDILRYDRYVAGDAYCDWGERAEASFVPSADQAACGVYTCERFERRDFLLFLPPPEPDHRPRRR